MELLASAAVRDLDAIVSDSALFSHEVHRSLIQACFFEANRLLNQLICRIATKLGDLLTIKWLRIICKTCDAITETGQEAVEMFSVVDHAHDTLSDHSWGPLAFVLSP
jgi:hypothetical protein